MSRLFLALSKMLFGSLSKPKKNKEMVIISSRHHTIDEESNKKLKSYYTVAVDQYS